MPTTATGITFSASLIDDYLQAGAPPVTGNIANAFAAVQSVVIGQPFTELLTLSGENTAILDFARDPASPSGWTQAATQGLDPSGVAIEWLHAFYQDDCLNLHVRYAGSVAQGMWWRAAVGRVSQGRWIEPRPSVPG